MNSRTALALLLVFAGTGCDILDSPPPVLYAAEAALPEERIGTSYRSVVVRDVSLPTHAAAETITIAQADGRILEAPDSFWADDPSRAVALRFTRSLAAVSSAQVANEPWPFFSPPEVAVDIRLETLLADSSGRYQASGQYFVAPEEPDAPEHAHSFVLSVSYDPTGGYTALAAARSKIIGDLALDVARRGLR